MPNSPITSASTTFPIPSQLPSAKILKAAAAATDSLNMLYFGPRYFPLNPNHTSVSVKAPAKRAQANIQRTLEGMCGSATPNSAQLKSSTSPNSHPTSSSRSSPPPFQTPTCHFNGGYSKKYKLPGSICPPPAHHLILQTLRYGFNAFQPTSDPILKKPQPHSNKPYGRTSILSKSTRLSLDLTSTSHTKSTSLSLHN